MGAVSFAAVLDEALGRAPVEPARAGRSARLAWGAGGPAHPAMPFLFARPLTSAVPRWPAVPVIEPRRPDHAFSDEERRAFNRLLDLGARLERNFNADQLRREYRRLAQRYHPDRHTGGSVVEQGRLGRTFAELTEHYRSLRALVESRH